MINLPKSMIKHMDYQTRQRRFNEEKDELLRKKNSIPPYELSMEIKKLIDKWNV